LKQRFQNLQNSIMTARPPPPNFSFESGSTLENFINCPDVNPSGLSRFHPSVLAVKLIEFLNIKPNKGLYPYIIASGVRHHPDNWTTPRGKDNLFNWLIPKYLKDVQEGKAMILLDQCLEGYHTPYLWQWFHDSCRTYNIPPQAIVYVTGNCTTEENYDSWCIANNIVDRIKTIPYTNFEHYVKFLVDKSKLYQSWSINLQYKKTNEIKTYNCLQKRLRTHRIWFYGELYNAGLLDCGLVSMNDYGTHVNHMDSIPPNMLLLEEARSVLPLEVYGKSNVQYDDSFYIDRILTEVFLDTWVSVVSEPIFADSDQAVFISEKTFKPIACMHPFIILGGRGSLVALRKLGYKTFEGFIDETYDTLSTFERIDAIIKELKRIDAIEDKLSWFAGMKDIIEHNYKVFHNSIQHQSTPSVELVKYYREYFNVY